MPTLELDDIQGLIARGYPDLTAASYTLLHVDDAQKAGQWLTRLADDVTPAPAHPSDWALNVAVTSDGLTQLGLDDQAMQHFSNEFRTGMTTPHRQRTLGDVGGGAPDRWLWGGPNTPTVHVLLIQFARDEPTLHERERTLASAFSDGGVSLIRTLATEVDLDGKEHFGFADGISQPTIDGLSSRADIPPNTIQPGEFVLGYVNEYGRYTERPLIDPSADPGSTLPQDVEGSGRRDLGRNGTYLVFRQLGQDVRGFWRFATQAAGPDHATWLASRIVGRWPSGAPLTLAPDADDPQVASANDFSYAHGDVLGLNCPIGAHVRRAHPRDSLDPDPGTADSVSLDKRHRLLRRGREYGPPVPESERLSDAPPDDPDRGLYFICLAGNISRQFELVQHTWLNNPKFDGLYDEPDPLTANHAALGASFSVQADPLRRRFTNLPNFVTMRGGGYFFLPGLRALRYIGQLPTRSRA